MKKFPISNFQFSIYDGFTFVELLTAIFVMIIVGGIMGAIFISSFKGTTKATLLDSARQNGAFVLSQVEKTVRNAQTISSPPAPCTALTPTPVASLTVTDANGVSTTFACQNNTVTLNGTSMIDATLLAIPAASCNFTCIQATSADFPTITTQFTINQAKTTSFYEQKVSIPFQSSVTLRNLIR